MRSNRPRHLRPIKLSLTLTEGTLAAMIEILKREQAFRAHCREDALDEPGTWGIGDALLMFRLARVITTLERAADRHWLDPA